MWFKVVGEIGNIQTIATGQSIRELNRKMKHLLSSRKNWVVCVKNKGYQAALERRKIYQVINDNQALSHGLIRVVDESGQSYLYPRQYFAPIKLPHPLEKALALAA